MKNLFTILLLFVLTTFCSSKKKYADENLKNELKTDSLDLDQEFSFFNENEFNKGKLNGFSKCSIDSLGIIDNLGLKITNDCKDICETYLVKIQNGKKMELVSNFDVGILNAVFSPSCRRMVTYSSYDGPDFAEFYGYRSEINIYNKGFQKIDSTSNYLNYYSQKWSIDSLYFLDEKTLAIRLYKGNRGDSLYYKKLKLK